MPLLWNKGYNRTFFECMKWNTERVGQKVGQMIAENLIAKMLTTETTKCIILNKES